MEETKPKIVEQNLKTLDQLKQLWLLKMHAYKIVNFAVLDIPVPVTYNKNQLKYKYNIFYINFFNFQFTKKKKKK